MSFSIDQLIADPEGHVVALNWRYENELGSLSNQLVLATPAGDLPLGSVTSEVAIGWLEAQISNTAEELDAAIRRRADEFNYAQSLSAYEVHEGGEPTKIEPPAAEQEAEVAAS